MAPIPETTKRSVEVELLPDHAYCLLPSIGSEIVSCPIFTAKPDFIQEIPFGSYLGKVQFFLVKINKQYI